MKDREAIEVMTFKNVNGSALLPVDERSHEFMQNHSGQTVSVKEVTARDVRFHRAYFALIRFIYSWATPAFKAKVSEANFYNWLKVLCGQYVILYEFKNLPPLIEYESISFGRMTQAKFRDYVRAQLPTIYTEFIGALYPDDQEKVNMIIDTIEYEFENYLEQL